jgi:hypothetical protein
MTQASKTITPLNPFEDSRTQLPFLWTGLIWIAISLAVIVLTDKPVVECLRWFLLLWALCMFDLLALSKTAGFASLLLTDATADRKAPLTFQAFFWGGAKLACLALLGMVLWLGRNAPSTGLILGISTLLVVPLAGGLWWSQKELNHA